MTEKVDDDGELMKGKDNGGELMVGKDDGGEGCWWRRLMMEEVVNEKREGEGRGRGIIYRLMLNTISHLGQQTRDERLHHSSSITSNRQHDFRSAVRATKSC